jgi:hypothetical protein
MADQSSTYSSLCSLLGRTAIQRLRLVLACQPYLTSLSLTASFSQIFKHSNSVQRIKVEPHDVVVPFFFILALNFIVLIVWTVADPLRWERIRVDDVPDGLHLAETATYGSCEGDNGIVFLGVLFGFNLVVSIVALIQAYECRKISTEYSESMWITAALICFLQVWIIGLPVILLLADNPMALFFVRVGIVFVTCMSTLLLLFVPKIKYLNEARQQQVESASGVSTAGSKQNPASQTTDATGPGARNVKVSGSDAGRKSQSQSVIEGIKIVQGGGRRSEGVQRMQNNVDRAEKRNRILKDRLERLQEKYSKHSENDFSTYDAYDE